MITNEWPAAHTKTEAPAQQGETKMTGLRTKFLSGFAALAVAGALTFGAGSANAVSIAGINFDAGDIFTVGSVYENIITGNGQTLSGYGEISQINGSGDFCAAGPLQCELTFQFGGLTSQNFSGTSVDFTGGWLNLYAGTGADNDFNPFTSASSAEDIVEATNGTLFLTLVGHENLVGGILSVLFANGNSFGTGNDVGSGEGLFDVDLLGGGAANGNFDTNTQADNLLGFADFTMTSSFGNNVVPAHQAGQCPFQGAACLAGSGDLRGRAIPEPGTLAVFGLGLLGLVGLRRRRNKA